MPFVEWDDLAQNKPEQEEAAQVKEDIQFWNALEGVDMSGYDKAYKSWSGFNQLAKDYYRARGKPLDIASGYRSKEHQAKLRAGYDTAMELFNAGKGPRPAPVAQPGRSKHQTREAIDISKEAANWLQKKGWDLSKYGLHLPVRGENWHLESIPEYDATIPEASQPVNLPGVKKIIDDATTAFGNVLGGGAGMVAAAHGADVDVNQPDYQAGAEQAGRSLVHGMRTGATAGLLQPPPDADLEPYGQSFGHLLGSAAPFGLARHMMPGAFRLTPIHEALADIMGFSALSGAGETIGTKGLDAFTLQGLEEAAGRAGETAVDIAPFAMLPMATQAAKLHPQSPWFQKPLSKADLIRKMMETRPGEPPGEPMRVGPGGDVYVGEAPPPALPPKPFSMDIPPRSPWEPPTEPMGPYHSWRRKVEGQPTDFRVGPGGEAMGPGEGPPPPMVPPSGGPPGPAQPMGGPPAVLPEVIPDDIIPPAITRSTDMFPGETGTISADVVTNQVLPRPKRTRSKKTPPGPTPPELKPEIHEISDKLTQIDEALASGVIEHDLDWELLQAHRNILLEQAQAHATPHFSDRVGVASKVSPTEALPPEVKAPTISPETPVVTELPSGVGRRRKAAPQAEPITTDASILKKAQVRLTEMEPGTPEFAAQEALIDELTGHRTPAPPPRVEPSTVSPAGEVSVPTRVVRRDRGGGVVDEFIIVPPTEKGDTYNLLKNVVKDGQIINTGSITRGKLSDIRRELDTNPEVGLGTRVHEPMDTLQVKPLQQFSEGIAVKERPEVAPSRRRKGTQGLTPAQQQAAEEVEATFTRMEDFNNQNKKYFKGIRDFWSKFKGSWVDAGAALDDIFRGYGDMGHNAIMRRSLAAGATSKVEMELDKLEKAAYGGLNEKDVNLLNRVAMARRIMAIDQSNTIRKKPQHGHPEGLTGAKAEAWLNALPDPVRHEMMRRSDIIYKHLDDLLDVMESERMLKPGGFDADGRYHWSEKERLRYSTDFYIPRKFIPSIDGPTYTYQIGGKTITVNGNGLHPLNKGSLDYLETNVKDLVHEYTNRVYQRIYRNRANRELLEIAENIPESGIVRRLGKYEKSAPYEDAIHVVSDKYGEVGQTVKLAMPKDLAQNWLITDPQLSTSVAKFFRTVSGTNILKALATGYNPAFGMANLPRDILHIYFTTFEYSSNPYKFAFEMANDLRATLGDAFFKRGSYVDFINEGGGLNLMTKQGQGPASGSWKQVQDVMGKVGETTEIWARLALRKRAIANGKTPEQATYIARSYMDFNQGGRTAKALDTILPYFNASIQGARGIGRAAAEHPYRTAWKVANIGMGVAVPLFLYNHLANPKVMDQISDTVKRNYWVVTLPGEMSYKDAAGNDKIFYMSIPKDQFSRVISTVFDTALAKFMGTKGYEGANLARAIADFVPVTGDNLPPTAKAYFGYKSNYDLWRQANIWKGANVKPSEEYYTARMGREPTHPLATAWGKLSGMSPVRTKYALEQLFTATNPGMLLPIEIFRVAMGGLSNADRETFSKELLTHIPMLNRFVRTTSPYTAYGETVAQHAQDVNTEKLKVRRDLDELAEIYYRDPTRENRGVIKRFIKEQDPIDQKDLVERFKFNNQVYDMPERDWWLHTFSLPAEAKAKAFFDKYNTLDEDGRKDLLKQAGRLKGYAGPKFKTELRRLLKPSRAANAGSG